MELSVFKYTGEETSKKVTLDPSIFGVDPKNHSIYLDVKRIQAAARQGTHKTKEKGEIIGSTRKLRKQKGTGNARVGSIKSPIFRGGGRIFGPRPRDYSFKLNKKVKAIARKSVLSYKAKANNITILENFDFQDHKTKNYCQMLKVLAVADLKTLLVLEDSKKNILLSGGNIPNARITVVETLNTYDILNANKVIFSEKALEKITGILKSSE